MSTEASVEHHAAPPGPQHGAAGGQLATKADGGTREPAASSLSRAVAQVIGRPGNHEARPDRAATVGPFVDSDRGGGAPLSPADRQEAPDPSHSLLGAVRLHTDARAAAAARTLNARAFTSGTDIFFSAGRYAPELAKGRACWPTSWLTRWDHPPTPLAVTAEAAPSSWRPKCRSR